MSYPEYREEAPEHLDVSPETLRPEEYKEEIPEKEIPEVLYTKDVVAPTEEVQRKEHHTNRWLIIASGAALASDGYFNNVMTMTNTLFGKLFGKQLYTSHYSTQISNASIVGSIIGMIVIGVFLRSCWSSRRYRGNHYYAGAWRDLCDCGLSCAW